MLLRYNALEISSFKNLILERNYIIHKIKITNFVPHIGFSPAVYKKACKNYLVFLPAKGYQRHCQQGIIAFAQ